MKKSACSNHTIRVDQLEEAVKNFIVYQAGIADGLENVLRQIDAAKRQKKGSSHLEKALHSQQAERDRCMRTMLDLYPDWKNGILSQEEYLTLKTNLQESIASLDQSIEHLKKSIKSTDRQSESENPFIEHFRKYQTISELSRPIVAELIESIYVYEDRIIRIVPRFQTDYENLLEYIESNKDAALSVG